MIAVDSNLLVYAHRTDSPWHRAASACLTELIAGAGAWALPWPCVHEFLAVVTHDRIYAPPTPLETALRTAEAWLAAPNVALLAESEGYWAALQPLVLEGRAHGGRIHDARVAALCVEHGVSELWTADRDFSRYPRLRCRNPLVAK